MHATILNADGKGVLRMKELIAVALLVVVLGLFYILYLNGYGVVNAKSALYYFGTPRFGENRNCIKADFQCCNGWIKRVVRLPRSKTYQFVFSSNLTKGAVSVEIYGKGRDPIAVLDDHHPCACVVTGERRIYRVITRFKKADGEYQLCWNEV